jgi:hypothetical protein
MLSLQQPQLLFTQMPTVSPQPIFPATTIMPLTLVDIRVDMVSPVPVSREMDRISEKGGTSTEYRRRSREFIS